MKIFAAGVLALAALSAPILSARCAHAQSLVPNGDNGPAIQPKAPTPDVAPPALPGAGAPAGIATAPKVAKANQGDPTTELFTAVNANDYNSAQDAISRGADLNAQNPLGETPLDLSIALNHNSITFLILGARDEDSAPPTVASQPSPQGKARPMPASVESALPPTQTAAPAPPPEPGNNPGTPNPAAGFLGFGPKT